jgi:hypothetical protein
MAADIKGLIFVALGAYIALVVYNGFNANVTA